jgi:hypothetical protein
MSIESMMQYKGYYKQTETEKIHKEIFKESSDYKHYMLGIAQGLYFIYDLIKQYKDKLNNDELLEVIENFPCEEELLKEYFLKIKNSK